MPRKRKNRGHFKKGKDARRHVGFSTEACKRGYIAALEKAMQVSADRYAWLYRRIRSYYRKEKRNGKEEGRHFGGNHERPAWDPGEPTDLDGCPF